MAVIRGTLIQSAADTPTQLLLRFPSKTSQNVAREIIGAIISIDPGLVDDWAAASGSYEVSLARPRNLVIPGITTPAEKESIYYFASGFPSAVTGQGLGPVSTINFVSLVQELVADDELELVFNSFATGQINVIYFAIWYSETVLSELSIVQNLLST